MPSQRFYQWLYGQTVLANLILYAYLFWYLWLMITHGAAEMPNNTFKVAIVMSCFVGFALNSAAYTPPLTGPNGYLRHKFKIIRFFLIPFCVSSVSIACDSTKECRLLFPTLSFELVIQILVMFTIVFGGSFIHYCILPKKINFYSYLVSQHPQIQGINFSNDIDWAVTVSMNYKPLDEENDGDL